MEQQTPSSTGSSQHPGQPTRVLVVRCDGLRDRVGAAVSGAGVLAEVASSASFLSAMGELRQTQPDVIVGPVSAMTGMVASTGKALRRLAPSARLVAIAQPDERGEAATAVSSGFDDCVFEPADATQLLRAMCLAPVHKRDERASAERVEQATEQAAERGQSHSAQDGGKNNLQPDEPRESKPDHEARRPTLPPADGPLGDTDLVDAILRADQSLRGLAVRLLREQSGIAAADFVKQSSDVPAGHASASVPGQSDNLGFLHAPAPATEADLEPWAVWLSRWLLLGQRTHDLHSLAMTDELTGVWNRRYFRRFLDRLIDKAAQGRQQITLLLFDIDDFKRYNDSYGHPAGDEILRETAKLIQSLVREHDVVARIGGDEFAVVFWDKGEPRHPGSQHPDKVINIARRFQTAICEHRYPKLGQDATGRLTVSGGLASFPWDGRTSDELIERADVMAIESKRQGKNVICFGPGAAPNGKHD